MNAMNMPAMKLSTMLSQVAVIVTVSKTSLGLKRQDKQASKKSDINHGAEIGSSSTNVNRFKGRGADRVKEIDAIAEGLIADIKARSTDWHGQRLVNNTILQEVLGLYQQAKGSYDAKVTALVDDAPELIREAAGKIGDYNVKLPTEEEIRDAFSLSFDVSQIADTDKFKATGVDASLEEEMKRRFEDGVAAAFNNAQRDALQRVAKPVAHLIERMTAYDKSVGPDGKGGRLYDTTITNITDIGKVFRSFNVLNDPFLDGLAKQLDAFENIDADDLKKDKALRADMSAKAAAILDSLKDLI